MEHLALEIFDLTGTGSKYANLPEDATITITDTSEIFASGDVWSHSFTLNVHANAHIFGTSGDIHGSRLHEQVNNRRTRLWVDGHALFLGYLKLEDEVEVDENGDVDVTFESGQKTFDGMIEGTSAQEVSVGDVVIGIALNRKRVTKYNTTIGSWIDCEFKMDGLAAYAAKGLIPQNVVTDVQTFNISEYSRVTPYVQQWPKFVKSHGTIYDSSGTRLGDSESDYTNVQTPYDAGHPFCNINICYQLKANKDGEEVVSRGYTMRLANGNKTTDGGDNQTRYNNSPNFYLLFFIDRLFKDLNIHVEENQAMDIEDLRRVFMLNYGCYYEEIEGSDLDSESHKTPQGKTERYGQYYIPIVDGDGEQRLLKDWSEASKPIRKDDYAGKILLRNVKVIRRDPNEHPAVDHETLLEVGSVECTVNHFGTEQVGVLPNFKLDTYEIEDRLKSYSAYLAYATGENYPKVEISDIINAMKAMFGVRFLFSDDYKRVRIVLLRNVLHSAEIQKINCEIVDEDEKVENSIRGFRMTYGKGTEDASFYYKGFNDLFQRASKTWKDTTDKHDYSQWDLNAEYGNVKHSATAMNKTCYVTPVNGNAYVTKVDEEEDVLFPSIFEVGGFMDAEDGDCSRAEEEGKTIEEIRTGASPVIMNDVNGTYASLFSGELKAPTPQDYSYAPEIVTLGRFTTTSREYDSWIYANLRDYRITGDIDAFLGEGFKIRMEDNYAISNGGTPFDEADPGLQFGIMRSSGADSYILYAPDEEENESTMNDYWEIVPGEGAIDHPDTCDNYGNEWDYDGSFTITPAEAPAKLAELFPDSDVPFYNSNKGYITGVECFKCRDNEGHPEAVCVLVATSYSNTGTELYWGTIRNWVNYSVSQLQSISTAGQHFFIEAGSSWERGNTLLQLCKLAYGGETEPMKIDNGVGSRYGRFSLKLRAEKPNPYFDPELPEGFGNRRYLQIEKLNLRGRGLADQFYKEYSYWIRNARIVKRTVHMELAQLLTIDKTKRVTVGDVTGFINKMQYSVSNKTGLGMVTMEIMYI